MKNYIKTNFLNEKKQYLIEPNKILKIIFKHKKYGLSLKDAMKMLVKIVSGVETWGFMLKDKKGTVCLIKLEEGEIRGWKGQKVGIFTYHASPIYGDGELYGITYVNNEKLTMEELINYYEDVISKNVDTEDLVYPIKKYTVISKRQKTNLEGIKEAFKDDLTCFFSGVDKKSRIQGGVSVSFRLNIVEYVD